MKHARPQVPGSTGSRMRNRRRFRRWQEIGVDYQFDFSVIWEHFGTLLMGCLLTLQLSILAMLGALVFAVACVMALRFYPRFARIPVQAFVEVVRNTPFLVQVFFLFFGLPAAGIRLEPNVAAMIALGINGAAYAIEIIRGGVESVAKGQTEAAYALGLRPLQTFVHVVMKPALRTIYPALTSQFIFLMLTSSVVSSITARELTHVASELEATSFRSFEIYLTVTVLYGVMAILLSLAFTAIYRLAIDYPSR
jgi:polar amino acid transport system permease protein